MKLSIIIPVYNGEATIERLLKSIHTQKSHGLDIEILLVNDGSTDGTAAILDKYGRDANYRVFHTSNGGPAAARNLALDNALGDYIWMLDADDFVADDAFSVIESHLSPDIDVLGFGYLMQDMRGSTRVIQQRQADYTSGFQYLGKNDGRLYLWCHIYKAALLHNHRHRFDQKLYNLEDFLFNIQVLAEAGKVVITNDCLYHYLYNIGSVTKKHTLENRLKQLRSSQRLHEELHTLSMRFAASPDKQVILEEKLTLSTAGLFLSLILENYPSSFMRETIKVYRRKGMLPLKIWRVSFRKQLFYKLINMGWPLLIVNHCKNLFFPSSLPK